MNDPLGDRCPEWAAEMIDQLRQVEILLGNLPKVGATWQSDFAAKLIQRSVLATDEVFDEAKADLVFNRIVNKLSDEDYTVTEIVGFINLRLAYEQGPPYCDADEVIEALESPVP